MKFISLLLLLFVMGCTTVETNNTGMPLMSEDQIKETVKNFTAHQQSYKGLYTAIDMTVTLRNTQVLKAQLDQDARNAQWDRSKYMTEREKIDKKAKDGTEVFLSFFTPSRENNDLHKSKTNWHVYLDSDGHRWEGSVTKLKTGYAELRSIYPEHTPFGTPYLVTFPVQTTSFDDHNAKFVITGPLATSEVEFNIDGAEPK